MSLTAAVLGLVLYGTLTGVREGTLVSALLVGMIARWFNQHIGEGVQERLRAQRDVGTVPPARELEM